MAPLAHFSGSPLDRVDHVRSDPVAYAALLSDWRARLLLLDGHDPRVSDDGGLAWGGLASTSVSSNSVASSSVAGGAVADELILLGVVDDIPHFTAVTPAAGGAGFRSPAMWRALSILPAADAAIFGTALSLTGWHNTHRFCGRCGSATLLFRAGWGRRCTGCATEHFPRTDPVVIMLAQYQGRALIGRQARFPPGNYSALAGFLEPGESIEEAVRRELFEESGVPVGAVRYVASQPWPFGGAQLMIACIADALDDAITLDTRELEDAMWVTRDEARAAMGGDAAARFKAPPPFAIAHLLMQHWIGC
jgi:NAD+ diphosphatase